MLNQINVKKLAVGAAVGIAATAVFLFVSAIILFFTGISDRAIELIAVIATVFGVLTGGVVSSFGAKYCGWLSGGIAGIVYVLILWLISFLVLGDPDFMRLLINAVFGFVAGASGGIIGINFKPRRKKRRKI